MDAKALAKSKRAHSQHHKNKSYPNQKSKGISSVASGSAGSAKKPLGKLDGEKARQSQRIAKLPSNRDRYEDEFDLDLENLSGDSLSKASDVIVPKSKGADYHFLIAEARSQALSQSYSNSDSLRYLDDILPGGFIQGVGSMLSVRGEGISSWAGDDNFVVEDKTSAVQEASFLSLNLNALAEQLAKVDLSQRLFVEADLLSSEQGLEGSRANSNQESDQMRTTHESDFVANMSQDVASNKFTVKVNVVDTGFTQLGSHSSQVDTRDTTVSSQEPDFMNHIKDDLSSSELATNSGENVALEPTALLKDNIIAVSDNKLPKFEAAAAEAELDMLLDSFDDTKFFNSSGSNYSNTFSYSQQADSTTLPSKRGPDLLKTASATASFDDVLDDLLQGTSSNLKNQNGLSEPPGIKAVPHDTQSSSQSVTKSKESADFDSWLDSF